ncbi:aminotransferase class III-fold pyridoxal phosphate-dependent enzyme [Viridibacterium curvum]|uniref:Glutamate-1-semialdehyde 2,1-aminomutase n=1 Tax=Viridibacterium curvum TaxID=1101404 RepID=A0ABP9QBD4_9RHOO
MSDRYHQSEVLLERALRTIPLGSQTFSKSRTQYPHGVSPYFIEQGLGCKVTDVDGNQYTDFVMSLAAVTLGYSDPDVTAAVAAQLKSGVIYTLPHRLEMEVAEKLAEVVPCAEMTRFGKNGSDATAGAVRVARAHTGRERVAVCGYHGWQDWYIGSTARHRGVPQGVRALTHNFAYNDAEALDRLLASHQGEFAAVMLEPMNVAEPLPGYLAAVRDIAHAHGALLVFDETITGFRYEIGGAQQRFGVTPDLACFGKGLANGYPVSAVCGKAEYMKVMEEIFFSFTFGGELLSLAAAKATISTLQREPVIAGLKAKGERIKAGLAERITRHAAGEFAAVAGDATWSFFILKDTPRYTLWQLKTLFLQEMFARGFLTLGTHNVCHAHSDADIEALLAAYDQVLPILVSAVQNEDLEKQLRCAPLEPLFKLR